MTKISNRTITLIQKSGIIVTIQKSDMIVTIQKIDIIVTLINTTEAAKHMATNLTETKEKMDLIKIIKKTLFREEIMDIINLIIGVVIKGMIVEINIQEQITIEIS